VSEGGEWVVGLEIRSLRELFGASFLLNEDDEVVEWCQVLLFMDI
jgi:hypothetical protein